MTRRSPALSLHKKRGANIRAAFFVPVCSGLLLPVVPPAVRGGRRVRHRKQPGLFCLGEMVKTSPRPDHNVAIGSPWSVIPAIVHRLAFAVWTEVPPDISAAFPPGR